MNSRNLLTELRPLAPHIIGEIVRNVAVGETIYEGLFAVDIDPILDAYSKTTYGGWPEFSHDPMNNTYSILRLGMRPQKPVPKLGSHEVKVGDTIRITHKVDKPGIGWTCDMNEYIGKTYVVSYVYEEHVRLEDKDSWNWPHECYEIVHAVGTEPKSIKPGDLVIIGKFPNGKNGLGWSGIMNKTIGLTGVVAHRNRSFLDAREVKVENGDTWTYLEEALTPLVSTPVVNPKKLDPKKTIDEQLGIITRDKQPKDKSQMTDTKETTTKKSKYVKSDNLKGLSEAVASLMSESIGSMVDMDRLREIIKEEFAILPPLKVQLVVNNQEMPVSEEYMRPELQDVLHRAMNRLNILMVGPAGCGKTHIARQVSKLMKLKYGSISCSAGMSESHLTGWLIPIGDGGKFQYVPSVFVDIYENGGVFLFDEIDAADSNTLLFVNQALANGSFFVPQRHENPEVKKHPDCIIMAAANTYGTGGNIVYAGREKLDESTLDRFRAGVVEIGYDETLEKMLIDKDILSWGNELRKKITDTKLLRVMSTRFMIDATKLKKSGSDMSLIKKTYYHGWREDEKKKVV